MNRVSAAITALFRRTPAAPAAPAPANSGNTPLYQQTAVYRLFDFMAGIPDPDEVLRRTGRTRADLRALLRDAEVAQALDTRHDAVVATPWRLEGGEDTPQGKFLLEQLTPHVHGLVSNAWQAVPYGYSVLEVVYARVGGQIGVDKVHAPPFEWFRPLPDGSLRYFPLTGAPIGGEQCDPRKFVIATRKATYRNPYGESLLAPLYWPTTWRLQGWQLWLDFLDTFGTPIITGRTNDYDKFVDAMKLQGVKRAIAWQPTSEHDDLKAITASTPGEFERLEDALNRTIQKAILGQTLTSEAGKVGSQALGKVHNDVREDKRRADLRIVTDAAQLVVDNLWSLNGFAGPSPRFVMQDDVGLERERADRDAVLTTIGVRFTPEYVAEQYGLEDEDFTIADPTIGAGGPSISGVQPRESIKQAAAVAAMVEALFRQTAGSRKFTPEQQAVEDGVAGVLAQASQPITREELRGAITGARDQHDLAARLAVFIDRQNPAFAELLAKAQFAAQVLGYVHEAEGTTP